MQNWVIRLPFSDRPDIPILVHVTRKDDGHDLDLDLLATEGDSAYRAKGDDESVLELLVLTFVSEVSKD